MPTYTVKGSATISYSWSDDATCTVLFEHSALGINEDDAHGDFQKVLQDGHGSADFDINTDFDAENIDEVKRKINDLSDTDSWEISGEIAGNSEIVSMEIESVELDVKVYEVRDSLTEDEQKLIDRAKETIKTLSVLLDPFRKLLALVPESQKEDIQEGAVKIEQFGNHIGVLENLVTRIADKMLEKEVELD